MTAKGILFAAAAVVTAGSANAQTTINFDNLGNGVVVTNQYAGVTFSSIPGSQVITTAQSLGSSPPNFICSGRDGSINCVDPIYVDFAGPVSGLHFLAVGDNEAGLNGSVSVYGSDNALLGTVNTYGDNNFDTPFNVDLTAFTGITRIAITNTDPGGLGYDDFTFNTGGGSAVPEPGTWAMMLAGFGLIGAVIRYRGKRTTVTFA